MPEASTVFVLGVVRSNWGVNVKSVGSHKIHQNLAVLKYNQSLMIFPFCFCYL